MLSSRFAPMIAACAFVGCSPYDPDLGPQPFLCGNADPRCPDGYVCVERIGEDVCQSSAAVSDAGGDAHLQCSGDTDLEPNETIEMPTDVPIPGSGETHMFSAVICPETDIDIFRLNVDVTGKNIRAEMTYDAQQGELELDLLNSTGVAIRPGTPVNNDPNTLRADFENLAQGTYYGRVKSAGLLNSYEITFTVTANPLMQ